MRKLFLFIILTLDVGLWTLDGFSEDRVTQSVANTVNVMFRDSTTGLGKTGIAVTGITCDLAKHTSTLAATKTTFTCAASGSSNDCVEIAHGLYNVELSAANLDTRGTAVMVCQCSGALDSKNTIEVVAAASYAINIDGDVSDNATVAASVWDLTTAGHGTANTFGGAVGTNLDLPISTINTAITAIPTNFLDYPSGVETNYSLRQALRLILSTQVGKLSGVNSSTPTFRDINDTKNRVTSTTDATGRTSVTVDPN